MERVMPDLKDVLAKKPNYQTLQREKEDLECQIELLETENTEHLKTIERLSNANKILVKPYEEVIKDLEEKTMKLLSEEAQTAIRFMRNTLNMIPEGGWD